MAFYRECIIYLAHANQNMCSPNVGFQRASSFLRAGDLNRAWCFLTLNTADNPNSMFLFLRNSSVDVKAFLCKSVEIVLFHVSNVFYMYPMNTLELMKHFTILFFLYEILIQLDPIE